MGKLTRDATTEQKVQATAEQKAQATAYEKAARERKSACSAKVTELKKELELL